VETTSGFTSSQLLSEEQILTLPSFGVTQALEIGEIAKSLGVLRNLPIAIEVRLGDWIITMYPYQVAHQKMTGGYHVKQEL
jgi:uncharacterized protein (UPF0303 family)